MNELTWEQEQDIQDYNIWLAEEQAKRHYSQRIRFRISTPEELIEVIEGRKAAISKFEPGYAQDISQAFEDGMNEALGYVQDYIRTLQESEASN